MTNPKDLDPAESPRAFYGSELRRLREARGLSQSALGELVFCSGNYIGQIEAAVRRPQEDLSERLDTALGTDGHFARLYPMVTRPRFAEYFTAAAELERQAVTISAYAPLLVPGLLQTPDYARAVFRSAQPLRHTTENEKLVNRRMERAVILDGPTRPLFWVVIEEHALLRPVGGHAAMHGQLVHLAQLVADGRIILQVMPIRSGAHALLEGSLSLMTFADSPPAAYVEGPHTGELLDAPSSFAACKLSFDLVRADALPPEASLALLEAAAEEHAHGQH
ncbi:helix-turn-helix domain-containing protein [Kitasatospora sp. NPDC004289]